MFANGDIDSVEQARRVLAHTGADGVLIGRAALGAPWLPGDVATALATGRAPRARSIDEVLTIAAGHITQMHDFYGAEQGVRIARKHVKAYLQRLGDRPRGDSRIQRKRNAERPARLDRGVSRRRSRA